MKQDGVFLCDRVIIDQRTNMLSLINLCDPSLTPRGFPIVFPSITYVCYLEKDSDTDTDIYEGKISVTNNSTVIIEMPVKIDFQKSPRTRLIMEFNGLTILNGNELTFNLEIDNCESSIKKRVLISPIVNTIQA